MKTDEFVKDLSKQLDLVCEASCQLPTPWATFNLHVFVEQATQKEHLAISLGNIGGISPALCRIHSECMTGDTLFSKRCDCGPQLELSLKKIAEEGSGLLIYLRQEGRGIGLTNKIKAYSLQEKGLDTVTSNHYLGFGDDERNYDLCQPILSFFEIKAVRLLTNNPKKIHALEALGFDVLRVPLVTTPNKFNTFYLNTKIHKMGHLSDLFKPSVNPDIS